MNYIKKIKTKINNHYKDCKVQIAFEFAGPYRYFYFRLDPKSISLFKRWFLNPWKQFRHECCGGLVSCYDATMFNDHIRFIETYGEALSYNICQKELANIKYKELCLS